MSKFKSHLLILLTIFINNMYSKNILIKLVNKSGREIYWQYKFESKCCCKDNSTYDKSSHYFENNSDIIIPINQGVKISGEYLPNKILIFKEVTPNICLEIDVRKETFIHNEEKEFIVLSDLHGNLYFQDSSSCIIL